MSALLVTYDLKKPGKDYKRLHDAIKGLGLTWLHCLESTWLVVTTQTAAAASTALLHHIDPNDRLLVLDISGDAFHGWLTEEAWEWIRKHV